MTDSTLLSTAYLPPVAWIQALYHADTVLVEAHEHYQKQSYRNRCHIGAANGAMPLSIPVEHDKRAKQLTRDIRLSEHGDWQRQHWRSLESAYRTTPFFEYYQDDFAPFYHKKYDFLWDFNMELLHKCLELLDVEKEIGTTAEYCAEYGENVVDLRHVIHPKRTYEFDAKPYYQVFDEKYGFQRDLSVVDLLFNMGNESVLMINGL